MHVIDPRSNLLSRLLWGLLLGLLQRHPAQAQIAPTWSGQVVDAQSGQPIAHATVQCGAPCAEPSVRTDAQGHFTLNTSGHPPRLSVRACGYSRLNDTLASVSPNSLALQPIRPKALYLSVFGIGSRPLRESALKLAAATGNQCLGHRCERRPWTGAASQCLGGRIGPGPAKTITVADMPALVRQLKAQNLTHRPGGGVQRQPVGQRSHAMGRPPRRWQPVARWEDVAWIDPFQQGAWDRSLALAGKRPRKWALTRSIRLHPLPRCHGAGLQRARDRVTSCGHDQRLSGCRPPTTGSIQRADRRRHLWLRGLEHQRHPDRPNNSKPSPRMSITCRPCSTHRGSPLAFPNTRNPWPNRMPSLTHTQTG